MEAGFWRGNRKRKVLRLRLLGEDLHFWRGAPQQAQGEDIRPGDEEGDEGQEHEEVRHPLRVRSLP